MQRIWGIFSYSASSNNPMLEACLSSPPVHTPSLADGSFPVDPSIAPLPPSFTAAKESTTKIGDGDNIAKGNTILEETEQEMEGGNADADGDGGSEESTDWDTESAEDTLDNNSPQPRQVVKRAQLPQTMGFHLDWWIARIATAAVNVSVPFPFLCP
ncbi:hypothetical protein AYL99_08766 [Fonsecaea erecta]|uniref:Uncharacterized protein n=1 Tax=Fonsecaea erecta TaxID=1367422 RepID=A0A178ZA52_9EURO|nr:hypothetical protein AYL99_08766 [Fonsecaea erecta]OAP56654.1 hypothetical protein AYL99_08766 [Fonsecaea erecta]